jgi:hypothetical protein
MSIRKSSAQTAINRGTAAAAVATVNQITIAPATATSVAGGGLLGGVTISNVAITDATFATVLSGDTAVSSAGGFVRVTGSGFRTGANVFLNNVLCSNSFVSSTQINATIPASANGTYTFAVFNTDGTGGVWVPGLAVSGPPAWTQTAYTANATTLSIQLLASGDAPLTYYIQPGSSNPQNLAVSSTGLLTGTVPADGSYSITVIVDDAQSQSTQATISIAVSTTDPYFNLTTLALPADTGANVWIADASTNKFNQTVNGDTRPTKFSPYWTMWSNFFVASSAHALSAVTGADTAPGTGDFCAEFWYYSTSTLSQGIFGNLENVTDTQWIIAFVSGTTIRLQGWNTVYVSGNSGPLNQWNHVAVCRSGTTMSIFVNGVRVGTATVTNNFSGTSNIRVGGPSGLDNFNGYLSNVRFVKGSSVYDPTQSTITVPTSPLTNIANTKFLTCQSNRFVDNSTANGGTGYAITLSGSPQVSTFAPFSESDQNIGSGYFDGTGDYLNGSITAIGTNDFSVEFWAYLITHSGLGEEGGYFQISAASGGLSTSYNEGIIAARSGAGAGRVLTVNVGGTAINTSFVLRLNEWFHTVITRVSNTVRIFVNGVLVSTPTTVSTNLTGTFCSIGGYYSTSYLMLGYIADCRVIVGTGFTSITVPTSPLTAVANTRLLTLQYPLGENNHRFVDESANRFLITRNGNATQGTFTPFSPTGWSNYFGGNGNFVWTATATNVVSPILNTQWTCEFFVFPTGTGACAAISSGGSAWANIFSLRWTASGSSGFFTSGGNAGSSSGYSITSATSYPPGQWYHIAVTKNSSNVWTLFVNGTNVGTSTFNFGTSAAAYHLILNGVYDNNGLGNSGGSFYISNFRITQNAVLYTSNFTPTTTPFTTTASSGTVSFLTSQSNRFIDNSSNAIVLTPSGSPSVQAFSPFAPTAAYSVANVGGSGYFDGTGDYLSIASGMNVGTSDFTIEAWVYPTAWTVEFTSVFSTRATNSTAGATDVWVLGVHNSGYPYIYSGAFQIQGSAGQVVLNAWTHLAVSRSGSTMRLFVNGALVQTSTTNQNYTQAAGAVGANRNGSEQWTGYLSNVRLVSGTAVYTSSFTSPTAPLTATTNTSLLLNFTNAGITDATAKNVLEAFGEARVSVVQSKFGSSSMAFDGTGDYLVGPASPSNNLNIGDFTLEFWVYRTNLTGDVDPIGCGNSSNTGYQVRIKGTTGFVQFLVVGGASLTTTTGITAATWQHIAIVRSGTTVRMYINGVDAGGSGTVGNSGTVTTELLVIGANRFDYSNTLNGYIDDLRITRGFARYTANFTPPTETFRLR